MQYEHQNIVEKIKKMIGRVSSFHLSSLIVSVMQEKGRNTCHYKIANRIVFCLDEGSDMYAYVCNY